jgi:hypothetical protein
VVRIHSGAFCENPARTVTYGAGFPDPAGVGSAVGREQIRTAEGAIFVPVAQDDPAGVVDPGAADRHVQQPSDGAVASEVDAVGAVSDHIAVAVEAGRAPRMTPS